MAYESQDTYECLTPDHQPAFKNLFNLLLLFISAAKFKLTWAVIIEEYSKTYH